MRSVTCSPDNPSLPGGRPATAPVSSPLRQPPRCSAVNDSLLCRGALSRVSVLCAKSVRRVVPVRMSSALLVPSRSRISPTYRYSKSRTFVRKYDTESARSRSLQSEIALAADGPTGSTLNDGHLVPIMGWPDRPRGKLAIIGNLDLLAIVAAGLRLRSRAAWGGAVSRLRLSIGPGIRRIASPPSEIGATRAVRYGDDVMAIIAGDESGDSLSLPRSAPMQ
jgi:hypothetical protein